MQAKIAARIERAKKIGYAILVRNLKKKLSVPAPRKRVLGKLPEPGEKPSKVAGVWYYKSLTKATAGDPPRKLSGRLRASVYMGADYVGIAAVYAKRLEHEGHPFVAPTIEESLPEMAEKMTKALGAL